MIAGFRNANNIRLISQTIPSIILVTVGLSCKTREFNNDSSQNSVQKVGAGCKVEVKPSVAEIFKQSGDLFKQKLLADKNCSTVEKRIPNADKILQANGCVRLGRSIVAESAAFKEIPLSGLEPRFADLWDCTGKNETSERIFIAGPGPGAAFHIIAADPNTGGYNFYSGNTGKENADFVFHGNSFSMGRISEYGALNSASFPQHPCTTCHQNGGPIMKELRFPWANWASSFIGGGHQLLRNVIAKRNEDGGPFFTAEDFEREIQKSAIRLNTFRIKKLKEGEIVNTPLVHSETANKISLGMMLQPILCQNEINLATSQTKVGKGPNLVVPADLFLNRLLFTDGQAKPFQLTTTRESRLSTRGNLDNNDFEGFSSLVRIPASKTAAGAAGWAEQLAANGVKHPIEGKLGSDGLFAMLIPARSFSDDDYVARLVKEGVLAEKFVQDLLMIDYQNPVFSKTRCDLLNKDFFNITASGQTPEKLQASIEGGFKSANLPGFAEYTAIKSKSAADHANLIMSYTKSCADNIPKKIGTLFMYTQTKINFLKNSDKDVPMFAVEGFVRDKIFPIHALKPADLNIRLKASTYLAPLPAADNCTLEKF